MSCPKYESKNLVEITKRARMIADIRLTNIPLYNIDDTYFFFLLDEDIKGVMPYDRPTQKSKMNAKIEVASETAAS